ncbi:MAG: ABC transporter substrate-binding protein, partial [Chloroflexota bacterium]
IVKKIEANPDKYRYWNFKAWPSPNKLTQAYVAAIENAINQGLWAPDQKLAVIYGEDTDWGHSFNNGIKVQLEKAGWTIIAEKYAPLDETDFSTDLADFKQQSVQLLIVSGANEAFQTTFVNQAQAANLEAVLVADCLGCTGGWYELTGTSSDYVLDQVPGWVTEEAKAFVGQFEARWGHQPGPQTAGLSYDYANFFIKMAQGTLEEHGALTSETLHQFGQDVVKTGQMSYTDGIIMPLYQYSPETSPDPIVGPDHFMFPVLQYKQGEGVIIWPENWKEADFQRKPDNG